MKNIRRLTLLLLAVAATALSSCALNVCFLMLMRNGGNPQPFLILSEEGEVFSQ